MFNHFTEAQRTASTSLNSSLSVRASAGSGKTATLVERYLSIVKSGVRPRNILTVTFTKEASQQLKDRILERMIETQIPVEIQKELIDTRYIGTLHSLCYWILNTYGHELSFPPIESIMDEFELVSAFEEEYHKWIDQLPQEQLSKLLERFTHRELREVASEIYRNRYLFTDCYDLSKTSNAGDSGRETIELLASSLSSLNFALTQRFQLKGIYSFDDLENLTLKLLKESALIRTRVSSLFESILVDEFQDTSANQWQILRIILGDSFHKLFIVGDPKQSIYGFRQAEPSLFEEVSQLILAKGGSNIDLLHNFRSHPNLLTHLNIISELLFTDQPFCWSPMLPGREGDFPKEICPFSLEFFGPNEKTSRQDLQSFEVECVAQHVQEIIDKGVPFGSVALLFRNSDRIFEFSQSLNKKNIPTDCKTTQSLSKQFDSLDLISFLRLLIDPTHDPSVVAFLRSPYVNWSYQQVLELCQKRIIVEKIPESLFLALERLFPERFKWVFELAKREENDILKCLNELFFQTRVFPRNEEAFYALLKPFMKENASLSELRPLIESFTQGNYFFQQEEIHPQDRGGVKLMTVHASKGLEFDHVFLVDTLRQSPHEMPSVLLKSGLPPGIRFWEHEKKVCSGSYQSILEEKRLKEEQEARRILYVALTRAKKSLRLFLPYSTAIRYPKDSWAYFISNETGEVATKSPQSPDQVVVCTT